MAYSVHFSIPLNTMPRDASSVTVVPLFKICTAFSAATITGLSSVSPTIAAWEFIPPNSVMIPAAFFMIRRILLLVCGMTVSYTHLTLPTN